ncbi:hypothetical protein JTE90_026206 [Oedothorax gibbosus]|uniref:Peptidase S1 domain-containing protein n=1 Tax=Oedothorax gibbosus TaxID=931172 RepID=A0AAV6TQX0_9ARAC|nr:hypothetical protein JTE90_026206 [Oedothorax gibbosus]
MRSLLIVIGCFVSVWERGVSDASANIETEGLIYGGTFAEPTEYPFVAEIKLNTANGAFFQCAGSILSQWWIVTAAHCLQWGDSFSVIVGQYNLTEKSPFQNQHNVSFSVIHRSFNTTGNDLNNDIALLKMEKKILFNAFVKPANLPTSDVDYSGRTGTVIGWGFTEINLTSPVLRELQVVIEGYEKCGRTYIENKSSRGPSSYEICAKSNKNQGACSGDSGGPLIVKEGNKDVVIGVLSAGYNSCGTEIPEIYVLIYKFQNWIAGVMQRYTRIISIQRGGERKIRV